MPLDRRLFRRVEIYDSLRVVDSFEPSHFPVSFGQLRGFFSIQSIQIQMPVATAFARPQKPLAVFQKIQIVGNVDPVRVFFRHQHARFSSLRIRKQQLQLRLRTVQALDRKPLRIPQPIHPRNVLVCLGPSIDRPGVASVDAHRKHMHNRIVAARHRIPFFLRISVIGSKIHQWILRDLRLIHFEERYLGRIGRPPVSRLQIQFFRIDPIEFSFPNCLRTATRQCPLFRIGNAHKKEVVCPHKAYKLPVWRNLYVGDGLFPCHEGPDALRFQVKPSQRFRADE